jgi:hypothetical protein
MQATKMLKKKRLGNSSADLPKHCYQCCCNIVSDGRDKYASNKDAQKEETWQLISTTCCRNFHGAAAMRGRPGIFINVAVILSAMAATSMQATKMLRKEETWRHTNLLFVEKRANAATFQTPTAEPW